ncbi:MAG: ABC transporter, permease protein 1 (cluster 1, maltose/g3p/polyamine/iron), partial [uncultured Thermomicrobiales bacterium]
GGHRRIERRSAIGARPLASARDVRRLGLPPPVARPLRHLRRRAAARRRRAQLLPVRHLDAAGVRRPRQLPSPLRRRPHPRRLPQHRRLRRRHGRPRDGAGPAARRGDPPADPRRPPLRLPDRLLLPRPDLPCGGLDRLGVPLPHELRGHKLLPRDDRRSADPVAHLERLGDAGVGLPRRLEEPRLQLHPLRCRPPEHPSAPLRGGSDRRRRPALDLRQHHPADALADHVLCRRDRAHQRLPDLRLALHHDPGRTRGLHPDGRDVPARAGLPLLRHGVRRDGLPDALPRDPRLDADPVPVRPVLGPLRL